MSEQELMAKLDKMFGKKGLTNGSNKGNHGDSAN